MPYDHSLLLREIDNYQDTVWALGAFVHECRWNSSARELDPSVLFGIGRPMRRTDGAEATPDAVIQRTPTNGIVAEAKHTFPPGQEVGRRDEILAQLRRYDDDLRGWWTQSGSIERHDIVLLTHLTHATEASDYLARQRDGFSRNISVVGYFRHDQRELYITLKKESGDLLDEPLGEKLRQSVPIGTRHIEALQKKFYDSPPPLPYTLLLLWDFVFPVYSEAIERDQAKGYTPIPVTVDQVTTDLQRYYGYEPDGTGNRGIPRSEWVRDAFEGLKSIGMAHRGDTAGSYVIRYKRINEDRMQRFGRLLHARAELLQSRQQRRRRQPGLFDDAQA